MALLRGASTIQPAERLAGDYAELRTAHVRFEDCEMFVAVEVLLVGEGPDAPARSAPGTSISTAGSTMV